MRYHTPASFDDAIAIAAQDDKARGGLAEVRVFMHLDPFAQRLKLRHRAHAF